MTAPKILSDEEVNEMQLRAHKCVPSDVLFLCQTVRALRNHNLDLRNEIDRGARCEECDEWEYNEDGSCRTFTVCGACWNKRTAELTVLRDQLAQVEKERDALRQQLDAEFERQAGADL